MLNELEIFKNNNYKHISNFVESKSNVLRQVKEFNSIYIKNINLIEELDKELKDEQNSNGYFRRYRFGGNRRRHFLL